jgi:PEP-CTERM motif
LLTSVVLAWVVTTASAQVVLNEHFTDGTLSFGSDPQDGNWLRQGGTSQTIGIVTDNVIGGGNALAYANQINGTLFIGQMQTPAVLGLNLGDQVQFSFDFRFTTLPSPSDSSIFRFGLYSHSGSAPTDGGTETNPDSGYLSNFGAGGSAGDAGWGKESSGGDSICGGGGAAALPGSITLIPVDINDTLAHHVLSTITRTASGISFATFFDNQQVDSATDNSSPFTSFNEVAFRLTGQASVNYDNIIVQIVAVPEPSVFALLGAGCALMLGAARKKARTSNYAAPE